jgi:hypothetical protein
MRFIRYYKRNPDDRVACLSETLQGIKLVRCNGWSDSFFDKVSGIRTDLNVGVVRKSRLLTMGSF